MLPGRDAVAIIPDLPGNVGSRTDNPFRWLLNFVGVWHSLESGVVDIEDAASF
jgi:hypothetical protein